MISSLEIITKTHIISQSLLTAYVNMQKLTAEKSIKKAEKMMSDFQKSKMASKTPGSGIKVDAVNKTDAPFDAFLVGSVFYGSPEAAMRAHDLHYKSIEKTTLGTLILQLVLLVTYCIVIGSYTKIPLAMALVLLSIFLDINDQRCISWLLSAIAANNMLSFGLRIIVAITVHLKLVPAKLNKFAMGWLTYISLMADFA